MDERRIVEVDGVQVFSSHFVMEQMLAQSRRINRIWFMAKLSLLISSLAFLAIFIFILVSAL